MKKQLLIGCGHSREKRMYVSDAKEWEELVTLDHSADCNPDVLHDLETLPYPFADNSFDEIHAYGVLEHLSDQGDYKSFFAQFTEFHRMLKPDGLLLAIVPSEKTNQQWGDPSHRRVINVVTLAFLAQKSYEECGKTLMTDFRSIYKADFAYMWGKDEESEGLMYFILKAIKPLPEVSGWTSEATPKA